MSKRPPAPPLIPPAPVASAQQKAARAAQRTDELRRCQEQITALLEEYDATFVVTELASFPNGVRVVRHSIDVVSR